MQRSNNLLPSLDLPSIETQPLLSHHSNGYSYWTKCLCCRSLSLRCLCLPSKAAILILFWTAIVGAIYQLIMGVAVLMVDNTNLSLTILDSFPYAPLAILMMFYPLSGFIADISCGRFKTIIFSLLLLMLSLIFASVGIFQLIIAKFFTPFVSMFKGVGITCLICVLLTAICFGIGLAGYEANFIQLGLDQLLEAPSVHLGMFVHLAKWAYSVLATVVTIFIAASMCYHKRILSSTLLFSPIILIILLVILLIFSCCKRHWFYTESGQLNPYKMVFNVLNFARKHRSPLRRSAFTYSDRTRPSRVDFAKERFGGPFTNEQVEDVKTFLRILVMLLVLGPVYVLQVPASRFVYPIFGFHVGHYLKHYLYVENCTAEWLVLQSGILMPTISTVTFPIYIWFIFSLIYKRMPNLFKRLGVGIVIFLLGVFSMLIIDVVGHTNLQNVALNGTVECMFHMKSRSSYYSLNVHWAALIPPNLLLGLGPLLLETTILEFVSAQSPHSMKGLLVGVFFAIKGLFQFLSSVVIIPFSLENLWGVSSLKKHSSVISCGSIYFLFTCVVGLTGLILFLIAAKKYKYRERDEVKFRQRDVEEIYERYLTEAAAAEESAYYADSYD